jgi:hypothetical protein
MQTRHRWYQPIAGLRPALVAAPIIGLIGLGGCVGLTKKLNQQETDLLRAQIQQSEETAAMLAATPDPEVGSQFSVFIPANLLNDLLKGAAKKTFTMTDPNFKDITVRIDGISTAFDRGLAYLTVGVTACKTPTSPGQDCAKPEVSLQTTAYLGITDSDIAGDGKSATLRVRIVDVVPSVKVGWFDFTLRGFVRRLLKAGLTQFVQDHVPALTVPLETRVPVRFGAFDQRVAIPGPRGGNSQLEGQLRTGGFNQDFVLKLRHPLFLSDGVRLYLVISQP